MRLAIVAALASVALASCGGGPIYGTLEIKCRKGTVGCDRACEITVDGVTQHLASEGSAEFVLTAGDYAVTGEITQQCGGHIPISDSAKVIAGMTVSRTY